MFEFNEEFKPRYKLQTTTIANAVTEDVHVRRPVTLHEDTYDKWLDPRFQIFLQPFPAEYMEKYEISSIVNSARNEAAELIFCY